VTCTVGSGVGFYDGNVIGKHPTGLIRTSCLQLMRIFAISVGLHSDFMEDSSLRSFAGLLKEIVRVTQFNIFPPIQKVFW